MARCEVRWISSEGKPTPDNNEAVYRGRTKPYVFDRGDGTFYEVSASRWFFVCEEHGKRLLNFPNWDWEKTENYPNYMAL